MGLKLGMFWLPLALILAAAALMWSYPIGAKRHRAIRARIQRRASQSSPS
jgi:Na+/melibiose symporter-like transporter